MRERAQNVSVANMHMKLDPMLCNTAHLQGPAVWVSGVSRTSLPTTHTAIATKTVPAGQKLGTPANYRRFEA